MNKINKKYNNKSVIYQIMARNKHILIINKLIYKSIILMKFLSKKAVYNLS